eukprot:178671-Prymnesium_polylepis.1
MMNSKDPQGDSICEGLAAAASDTSKKDACLAAAKTAIHKLHAASRSAPYAAGFTGAVAELL